MKNPLCMFILVFAALVGCTTTSEVIAEAPPPEPPTIQEALLKHTDDIVSMSGIAAVGIAKSKSEYLAINHAKKDLRRKLIIQLRERMDSFQNEVSLETSVESTFFDRITKNITDQILNLKSSVKSEKAGEIFTAYAFAELSPRTILDQLKSENIFFEQLLGTTALKDLEDDIKKYESYKAGLIYPPTTPPTNSED